MKINCIAIDDEYPALRQIENFISKIPYLNLLRTFDNAIEVIEYLKSNQVDLIFLDIQMEEFTGIQFLNSLKQRPKVILTTAYSTYALQAFDLDITDYLLKPISFERFVKAVEKVYEILKITNAVKSNTEVVESYKSKDDYLFVKTDYKIQRVDISEILYIEGLKEYLSIFTEKERVITLMSFKKIEEKLPCEDFVRVHKSYIVALKKIKTIEHNRIKIGDKIIPIGETYQKQFYDVLEKRKL